MQTGNQWSGIISVFSVCLTHLYGGLFLANIHSVLWNRAIRFERALFHDSGYIYRAAWSGSVFLYGGDYDMCVRESMCIQSKPHWPTASPSSALWWQCFYLVVYVFVCMHMDSQGLIKRSLMMLVISIVTHVSPGHPDWITPDLRQGNTWLQHQQVLKLSYRNRANKQWKKKKRKKKVKQKKTEQSRIW